MDARISTPAAAARPAAKPPRFDGLRLIAVLKFGKALLLIATSYGVHRLLNTDLLDRLYAWSLDLSDDRFERRLLVRALSWVEGLGAQRMQLFLAATIAYTVVVLAEGTGLWFRRAWAEWFTVIATGSLIPFELWELITRPPSRRLAIGITLLINVVIVWYLARLLRGRAARHRLEGQ
jgi:uncharacterized membrane protein (DUF2068 family)